MQNASNSLIYDAQTDQICVVFQPGDAPLPCAHPLAMPVPQSIVYLRLS